MDSLLGETFTETHVGFAKHAMQAQFAYVLSRLVADYVLNNTPSLDIVLSRWPTAYEGVDSLLQAFRDTPILFL